VRRAGFLQGSERGFRPSELRQEGLIAPTSFVVIAGDLAALEGNEQFSSVDQGDLDDGGLDALLVGVEELDQCNGVGVQRAELHWARACRIGDYGNIEHASPYVLTWAFVVAADLGALT
jgi:hypothetical protein